MQFLILLLGNDQYSYGPTLSVGQPYQFVPLPYGPNLPYYPAPILPPILNMNVFIIIYFKRYYWVCSRPLEIQNPVAPEPVEVNTSFRITSQPDNYQIANYNVQPNILLEFEDSKRGKTFWTNRIKKIWLHLSGYSSNRNVNWNIYKYWNNWWVSIY